MNYYIDFDNTLYNTPVLADRMLKSIVDNARIQKNIEIFEECKSKFNNDIYDLAKYFSDKYSLDLQTMIKNLNDTILNSSDLVFEDSIPFLQKLKNANHNIFLLSFSKDTIKYQTSKILGSGLIDFFDAIYITSKPKYELDIKYENGIFIDDNPKDLLGLYSKSAQKVIRLRRKENKYSVQDINNTEIEEYINFNEIDL